VRITEVVDGPGRWPVNGQASCSLVIFRSVAPQNRHGVVGTGRGYAQANAESAEFPPASWPRHSGAISYSLIPRLAY
jgi:hypothetical protein